MISTATIVASGDSVRAIGGRSKAAGAVHAFALTLAAAMFVYVVSELKPLFLYFSAEHNWAPVLYLLLACLVIPAYWPCVAYRLLLLATMSLLSKHRGETVDLLGETELPPLSIVIATRNEPSSVVIPSLQSLLALSYPHYEIVLADNSDIFHTTGAINRDFMEVVTFAKEHGVRIVRRSRDFLPIELPEVLSPGICGSGTKGDVRGGKAGNLNAAIESADERYKWFVILDADTLLPDRTLRQMVSIGVQGGTAHRPTGFVQSILAAANPNETSLSYAQSVIDEIYYNDYFRAKAAVGVVSNWGHGLLVSRLAWEATNGFPLEISEDLAWANELLLLGTFHNYYGLCHTLETKPATWKAFKIQRNRWAKGTTIQLRKQLARLWKSDRVLWHEKMDLTYDMTSYVFNAIGCLLPIFVVYSSVLGAGNRLFFRTLVPAFYVVAAMDNLLVPLGSARMACKRSLSIALQHLKAVPFVSIYLGAVASQIFIAVVSAVASKDSIFVVTPKADVYEREGLLSTLLNNKFCYLLFLINGWIAIHAWSMNPAIVPLLALSPIGYFFAPLLGAWVRQHSVMRDALLARDE